MAILKNKASKARPYDGIDYITKKEKTVNPETGERFVDTINMYADGSASAKEMANEFEEVYKLYDQCTGVDERKYYSFKLCFDNADENFTPEIGQKITLEWTDRCFNRSREEGGIGKFQSVTSTHFDSDETHSHVITSSVDMETGKKMNQSVYDMRWLKDQLYEISCKYGLTPVYWEDQYKEAQKRKKRDEIINREYPDLSPMEKDMLHRMGNEEFRKYCIKEKLRFQIDTAITNCKTKEEFDEYMLKQYNVVVSESRGAINFKYGEDKKDKVRGLKLGENYTKEAICKAVFNNRLKENTTYVTDIAIHRNQAVAISQGIKLDDATFQNQTTLDLTLLSGMAARLKELGFDNYQIKFSEWKEEDRERRFRLVVFDENQKPVTIKDDKFEEIRKSYMFCRGRKIENARELEDLKEKNIDRANSTTSKIKDAKNKLIEAEKKENKQRKVQNAVLDIYQNINEETTKKAKRLLHRNGYSDKQIAKTIKNISKITEETNKAIEKTTTIKEKLKNLQQKEEDLKEKLNLYEITAGCILEVQNANNYTLNKSRSKDKALEEIEEQIQSLKY